MGEPNFKKKIILDYKMANIVQRVLTYSSSILPKVNLHNHSAITKTRNKLQTLFRFYQCSH